MTQTYQRIVLASRPQGGAVSPDNFRLERVPVPGIGPGQVLVRNHFLSLDPYMRGRMSDAPSYAAPVQIDQVMEGGTVCSCKAIGCTPSSVAMRSSTSLRKRSVKCLRISPA